MPPLPKEQNAPDYSVIIRDRMKFSVVIPTYNRADLIKKSLESVYAQTYQDWEIIVVDNCSTDNTEEVMAEYVKRGKLSYLRNDRNYERSYSRNKGMKLAKGEYVTLLDSDDILYPDCLDKAAKFIDKNPESVFFHCCFEILNGNYKPVKRPVFPDIKNPFKAISKGNFISNIGVFYKRPLLDKVKFSEEPIIIGVEDYDFVLNTLLYTGKIDRINEYCCGVYEHSGRSVYHEEWERTHKRINYFIQKQLDNPLFNEKMKKYKGSFLAHTDLYLASFCAVHKMRTKSWFYITRSVRRYPPILGEVVFWKHIFVVIKKMF